jgi:hypothetical protein
MTHPAFGPRRRAPESDAPVADTMGARSGSASAADEDDEQGGAQ